MTDEERARIRRRAWRSVWIANYDRLERDAEEDARRLERDAAPGKTILTTDSIPEPVNDWIH